MQSYFKELLQTRLSELQHKNPSYSLRAYADKLRLSPSALSEFLKGKRRFSVRKIQTLTPLLNLSKDEELELYKQILASQVSKQKLDAYILDAEQGHIISDPIYYALLNTLKVKDIKTDPKSLAEALNTTESRIKGVIEVLKKHELLKELKDGRLKRINNPLGTSEGVKNQSLRQRYINNLEDAKQAVSRPVEERDFSFMTFASCPEALPQIREKVRKLYDEIDKITARKPKTHVYEINMQVFPRTKSPNKRSDRGD